MKTRLIPIALLSLLCVSAISAQVHRGRTWVSPCTLDVVLVTFRDATERAGGYDYHDHDLPYGYTRQRAPTSSSYRLRDFERLFNGGYDSLRDLAFVGDTVTVGNRMTNRDTLPEVFGSVRAYFDSISTNPNARPDSGPPGVFQLHMRMINPADSRGYPRWVELPQTKAYYADIDANDRGLTVDGRRRGNLFWDDAERAAQDSVANRWYPNTTAYDIPNSTYNTERRWGHKVLYLYSGATYSARSPDGLLHPQADRITSPNPPDSSYVGYRYVMGERQGWGDDNHSVDEFAGIGMHVHEIGHLLGFYHPRGEWGCSRPGLFASSCPAEEIRTNPYTGQYSSQEIVTETSNGETIRDTVQFLAARLSGWGSMQSGAHGPPVVGNGGYHSEYRSCPNPFNPFYRMELEWNARVNITTTTLNQHIEPGPDYFYVVQGANGQQYILDFRTVAEGFGRYTGWHRFTQSPGLLIWRRSTHFGRFNETLLIPADGRSIFDARQRRVQPEPTSVNSSYTYVWQDRLSDPFGAVEPGHPYDSLPGREHRPTVRHATDATHLRYALARTIVPGPSRLAFRNILIHRGASGGDYAEVDIYHNYWAGELERSTTWSGTVYVGGDVTVPASTTLTIERGTQVRFLADTDDIGGNNDTARSELIVEGVLTVESASEISAGGVTFRSDNTVDPSTTVEPSNDDWYGIRVRPGGTATLSDVTIQDGSRCVQNEGGILNMTNATLTNCGATVTLDPATPYTGLEITAELTPPGTLTATDEQWQWQRQRRSTDAWTNITSATTSAYTPVAGDIGSQLRATVRYQAEDDVYPYAQSAATAAVVGRPSASRNLMATPSSTGPVALAWDAPSSNRGSDITDYQYRYRAVGSKTWLPSANGASVGLTTRHTVQEPTNGVAYIFEVWAVNAAGAGDTTRVGVGTITLSSLSPRVEVPLRSTLMDPDEGEIDVRWDRSFTGSTSLRDPTAERASGALMTTFTPGRWNVGSRMQVEAFYDDAQGRGQRAYSVKTAPVQDRLEVSYESATYQASEGGSSVSIRVRLSGPDDQALTIPIKVRAGDNTESGDYAVKGLSNKQLLFPAGTIEKSFTIRALADPDSDDETVLLSFGALPAGVVVGTTRQATVTLLDDNDRALSLIASRGDSQVALSWTAPTNGSTISDYQVRWRVAYSGHGWPGWSPVSGGSSARSTTVTELTNGVTYQFEVQAVDSQGASVAVSNLVLATPAGRPGEPALTASPGDEQVMLSWTAAASNGSEIERYEVQWRVANSGHGWPGWSTVPGGSTARDSTVTGLTNGVLYEFAVRAVNGVGLGAQALQSARPQRPLPPPLAVRNLRSRNVDEDSAFIDWDAPSNANVAGPITYRARVNNGAIID